MFATAIALNALIIPVGYMLLMIVIWACVGSRIARLSIVFAMLLVPAYAAIKAWAQIQRVTEAERSFGEQCRSIPSPVVHGTASDVDSIVIEVSLSQPGASPAQYRHAVFPEQTARYLVQGAERYQTVERSLVGWTYEVVHQKDPTSVGRTTAPQSRYSVEWRPLEVRSDFISVGTIVVRDLKDKRVLGEQHTTHLHTPAISVFGGGFYELRVSQSKNLACPTARQSAHFIKSVARPSSK